MTHGETLTYKRVGKRSTSLPSAGSRAYVDDRSPRTNEPDALFDAAELYGCLCHRPTRDFLSTPPTHAQRADTS
jgi:hypothetical protein